MVVLVTIAFDRRCPPERAPRGPPVVLLHGSPGGRFDFHGVTDALARDRCVIAPDLPGFGDSTRDVPDYSVAAHAAYVDALLAALRRAPGARRRLQHGRRCGDRARRGGSPGAVASLTLLSGLGVQEQELFGRYWVNHAVHGVQLAALWLLIEATPHFGLFDRMFLGIEYAPQLLRHRPAAAPAGAPRATTGRRSSITAGTTSWCPTKRRWSTTGCCRRACS